jgi:hypothetical protein
MIGIKIPPALAVVEGIAGAIKTSANDRPYASPKVLFPKNLTNSWATLSPKPVFSNPYNTCISLFLVHQSRKLCMSTHLKSDQLKATESQHTLAKKKDTTISQITSFVKAVNVAAHVKVFVAIATVAARNAHAPTGRGSRTSPAIVETKMDRRVQPCCDIPSGVGTRN